MNTHTPPPILSIAVLSWNSKEITKACIESIIKNVRIRYELILIENGSIDGSAEMIHQDYPSFRYPQIVTIFNDENRGFAGGNNQAYAIARGKYFLLLNSDTLVPAGAIERMVDFLEDDRHTSYGAATCALLNVDGSTQYYMHRRFPHASSLLLALVHKRYRWFQPQSVKRYLYLDQNFSDDCDVEQAAGACLMVRKALIDDMRELLDEKHFPLYYNDVDLCYRIHQRGLRIRCVAQPRITHLKGTSVRTLSFFKNGKEYAYSSLWFFKKHHLTTDYLILKKLYLLLFLGLNAATPLLRATKKITPENARYRWSIVKTILTMRR